MYLQSFSSIIIGEIFLSYIKMSCSLLIVETEFIANPCVIPYRKGIIFNKNSIISFSLMSPRFLGCLISFVPLCVCLSLLIHPAYQLAIKLKLRLFESIRYDKSLINFFCSILTFSPSKSDIIIPSESLKRKNPRPSV